MKLDIHERDIDSQLCQTCGACCRITFKLRETTPRYRRFLREIGYTLLPPPAEGKPDCCDKRHDATVDMDFCSHLEISELAEGKHYRCRIHATPRYPELCEQFNCVSWAKANETYSARNSLLASAQQALNRLRNKGERK
jgi:hypothetical protein